MLPSPGRLRFSARDSNVPKSQGAREWGPRGIPQCPVAQHHQGSPRQEAGLGQELPAEVSRSCPCTDWDRRGWDRDEAGRI